MEEHGTLARALREALLNATRHGQPPVTATWRSGRAGGPSSATAAPASTGTRCPRTGSACASPSRAGWSAVVGSPGCVAEDGTEVFLCPPWKRARMRQPIRVPSTTTGCSQRSPQRTRRGGGRRDRKSSGRLPTSRPVSVSKAEQPDKSCPDVHPARWPWSWWGQTCSAAAWRRSRSRRADPLPSRCRSPMRPRTSSLSSVPARGAM